MEKDWEDDFEDDSLEEELDEREFDKVNRGKRAMHRQRVELLKEKQWLKEQLDDYTDYNDWN